VASHGMSQALIDRQFAASKAFFALPLSTKLKLKVGKIPYWLVQYSFQWLKVLWHSAHAALCVIS
jgi:isopenicillin N synthase-like dioxygenase